QVSLEETGFTARGPGLVGSLLAELRVDIPDCDLGSASGEAPAEGTAKPASSSGHHHGVAWLDPLTRNAVCHALSRCGFMASRDAMLGTAPQKETWAGIRRAGRS